MDSLLYLERSNQMDIHRIITTLNPKLADVKPFTKVDEYYMEIEVAAALQE